MGRTKGSSSKRPHVDEEAMPEPEEENLTKTYEANFPILSHEEGAILTDRKSTRLNSSHSGESRMPSSA